MSQITRVSYASWIDREDAILHGDIQGLKNALLKHDPEIKNQLVNDISALRSYTSFLYEIINKNLRDGVTSTRINKRIEDIKDNIKQAPTYKDLVLFRGIGQYMDLSIGDKIKDRGFMSKSTNIDVAKGFATLGTLFVLYYPGETKQIFMNPFSVYRNSDEVEDEMLTFPGESFTVEATFKLGPTINVVYVIFDDYASFDILIDPNIDQTFDKIERVFPDIATILESSFVAVKRNIPDEEVMIFHHRGILNFVDDDYFPIMVVRSISPERFHDFLLTTYYSNNLMGIYNVTIPEYTIFKITGKSSGSGLLTEKKEDSFTAAYVLITNEYENIIGEYLPIITPIWEISD